jgi:hypothetical protein
MEKFWWRNTTQFAALNECSPINHQSLAHFWPQQALKLLIITQPWYNKTLTLNYSINGSWVSFKDFCDVSQSGDHSKHNLAKFSYTHTIEKQGGCVTLCLP